LRRRFIASPARLPLQDQTVQNDAKGRPANQKRPADHCGLQPCQAAAHALPRTRGKPTFDPHMDSFGQRTHWPVAFEQGVGQRQPLIPPLDGSRSSV
jgi:hypothetical protein